MSFNKKSDLINHVLKPEIIRDYMNDKNYKNVFVSEIDLNNSFMAMGQK